MTARDLTAGGPIVWVVDSPGWGGSEVDLARVFEFVGRRAGVFVHAEPVSAELLAAARRHGMTCHAIPGGVTVRSAGRVLRHAARLIRRYRASLFVIWAHYCDSSRWVQVALSVTGRRFVVCQRSVPGDRRSFERSRLSMPVMRVVSRRARHVVVNGYGQRQVYRTTCSIPPSQLRVIVNSRPVRRIADRVTELRRRRDQLRAELGFGRQPVVTAVGRLSSEKDQLSLIRAAAGSDGRWTLCLVGDGPNRAAWEAAATPGISRFVGHQSDVLPWLAAADVYVLPSLIEGLSGGLIEAMAAGLPCVATDIPGNRELVTDGVTGLTVPVQSPGRLAAAIHRLVGDPEFSTRLATAGQAHVAEHYDEAVEREAWRRLIDELGGGGC